MNSRSDTKDEEEADLMPFNFVVNNNDKLIQICVHTSDVELCQKLANDDLYTFQYIQMLGEHKQISVGGPVHEVKRITTDEALLVLAEVNHLSDNEETQLSTDFRELPVLAEVNHLSDNEDTQLCLDARELPVSTEAANSDGTFETNTPVPPKSSESNTKSNRNNTNKKLPTPVLWNDKETSFLLDKYDAYVLHVGPMKKFKTKKVLWKKISEDLLEKFNITRDYIQVENRYKTCLKRKKSAVEHNSKSGNTREEVPFEEELARIAGNDDSIEPELLCSARKIKYLKVPPKKDPLPKRKNMQELAEELHKQREDAKERRHQEKLNLITALLRKNAE